MPALDHGVSRNPAIDHFDRPAWLAASQGILQDSGKYELVIQGIPEEIRVTQTQNSKGRRVAAGAGFDASVAFVVNRDPDRLPLARRNVVMVRSRDPGIWHQPPQQPAILAIQRRTAGFVRRKSGEPCHEFPGADRRRSPRRRSAAQAGDQFSAAEEQDRYDQRVQCLAQGRDPTSFVPARDRIPRFRWQVDAAQ